MGGETNTNMASIMKTDYPKMARAPVGKQVRVFIDGKMQALEEHA